MMRTFLALVVILVHVGQARRPRTPREIERDLKHPKAGPSTTNWKNQPCVEYIQNRPQSRPTALGLQKAEYKKDKAWSFTGMEEGYVHEFNRATGVAQIESMQSQCPNNPSRMKWYTVQCKADGEITGTPIPGKDFLMYKEGTLMGNIMRSKKLTCPVTAICGKTDDKELPLKMDVKFPRDLADDRWCPNGGRNSGKGKKVNWGKWPKPNSLVYREVGASITETAVTGYSFSTNLFAGFAGAVFGWVAVHYTCTISKRESYQYV